MKINRPALRLGCLLVAGAAVAVLPARSQMAPERASTQAPLATISSVSVAGADGQTAVRIRGNRELVYRSSRLDNPPRLVLDFAETRIAVPSNSVSSSFAPVSEVRIGQSSPEHSRLVIDLAEFVPFTVKSEGSNLIVSFDRTSGTQASVAVRAPGKASWKSLKEVSAPKMPLPPWVTGGKLAFAYPPPPPARPEPQQATGAPATPAPQAARMGFSQGPYTGEPISVNLKDVDLKDFFRLIHEISGLNVVLDPAVRGTVTLVLDEVPWDQGLDIVLRNNSLAKEIDGNVLRIATQGTLRREAEEQRDLAKAQSEVIEPVTTTRVLSYAKSDTLRDTVRRFLSPRGEVLSDTRSNTLIISDIPSSMPKVDNLLRQLDRKAQQVEIDARVVAASRSFARDIGTQFGFSAGMARFDGTAQNVFGGAAGAAGTTSPISHPTSLPPPLSASGTPLQMPLNSNFPAGAATSGITFAHASPNFALDFILTAMEAKGVGKLLSEPRGITQNNEKLTVKQGTKVPVQTTINNTVSVQFIDAVLKLEVTPQITADGTVFVDVMVENTQIDQGIPRVQGIPALNTQSTETKVLINDGGTVVIGGVVITSQRSDVTQVPLLGSVPLIGHLFKRTSVNVQSQELLFFVTPRILPG